MARTLIAHIGFLAGAGESNKLLRGPAMQELPVINDAWVMIEDGLIHSYGEAAETPDESAADHYIDARGQAVLPCWCDSHTHLVFAATREQEFVDKIRGRSYAEIAAAGGGILNSAAKLADASELELLRGAWARLQEIMQTGTGAVEIKSGYGLTVEAELKMLRVIQKLKESSPIPIKATFLAAHAFPPRFQQDHAGYIRLIIEEMLPVIAQEQLADYIDVFCETGFFSPDEMKQVCDAGARYDLVPKLHVNQLNSIGGIEEASWLGARSVDHLEVMTDEDIRILADSAMIGTLLPSAAFFLRMAPQPARRMIDAGAAIALASDYNPGSSPSGNMNLVVSMACIQCRMLPAEAINAATINGAFAMDLHQQVGSIAVGKRANLIITRQIPSLDYLPYSFGTSQIDRVLINGEAV